MKNNLTREEKNKLYNFLKKIKKDKLEFEISYSEKYLQKIKTLFNYFPPKTKS